MNDTDEFSDLDTIFGNTPKPREGSLIEPMEEDAYHNRYIALQEDVKKPQVQPNIYHDESFDDLDELLPAKPVVEASVEPQEDVEGSLGDKLLGGLKEAVAGPIEGIQGIMDVLNETEHALIDLGVPNYGVYYNLEEDTLKFGELSKEDTDKFSFGGANLTQYAPIVKPKEESLVGDFVNEATEFLTNYALGGAIFRVPGLASAAARGFAADYTDHEPEDGGLLKFANDIPELEPYIADWMVSQEGNSRPMQRFKLAAEGLGLGILTDLVVDKVSRAIEKKRGSKLKSEEETSTLKDEPQEQTIIESERVTEADDPPAASTKADEPKDTDKPESAKEDTKKAEEVKLTDPDEIDMSNEILELYKRDPTDPTVSQLYNEMAANGKIEARPSYVREVDEDQAYNILRGIKDPDRDYVAGSGFYNLDKIDSPSQVHDALVYTAREFEGSDALNSMTPVYRPQEDTIAEMAKDLGVNEKDIISNLQGVAQEVGKLDVYVSQARALQVQAASEAHASATKIIDYQASPREQLEFVRRLQQLETINELMTGLKTGTGRGLASMKITTSDLTSVEIEDTLQRIVCAI